MRVYGRLGGNLPIPMLYRRQAGIAYGCVEWKRATEDRVLSVLDRHGYGGEQRLISYIRERMIRRSNGK
jgi:hypothetical protein